MMGGHLGRVEGAWTLRGLETQFYCTYYDISSCISETAMSFVAALAPAPPESRVMEKVSEQLYSSTDLGTLQREDGSC